MYFPKALVFICALILIHNSQAHDGECTHDQIEQNIQFHDVEEQSAPADSEDRVLQSAYPNIRIYPHYDYLSTAPDSYRNYIQNTLVPPIIAYFQGAFKIKSPLTDKLKVSDKVTTVCDLNVPSILYTGVSSDMFVLFDSEMNEQKAWVAKSFFCYLAAGSSRPYVVMTRFNRRLFKEPKGDVLEHEKNTYLLMHEMIHNFGFSSIMYQYYIDENGQKRTGHVKTVMLQGTPRTVLDVPALTSRARKFFGCSNLEGIFMENDGADGTAGSHFERRHFFYETMTSGTLHGRRISQFTLGIVEATGWYVANYSFAEPFSFGQGQGCTFLRGSCNSDSFNFEEFCKNTDVGCAPTGRGGGTCIDDPKSDGCKFYSPYIGFDCENPDTADLARFPELQVFGRGTGSRCFAGNLTKATSKATQASFCFKYTCKGAGTNTTVDVQIGTRVLTCRHQGSMKVNGYNGEITCPDPLTFCSTVGKKYCPRNCMGRGSCVNNKCVCNKGFVGIDCGLNA